MRKDERQQVLDKLVDTPGGPAFLSALFDALDVFQLQGKTMAQCTVEDTRGQAQRVELSADVLRLLVICPARRRQISLEQLGMAYQCHRGPLGQLGSQLVPHVLRRTVEAIQGGGHEQN